MANEEPKQGDLERDVQAALTMVGELSKDSVARKMLREAFGEQAEVFYLLGMAYGYEMAMDIRFTNEVKP